ncbi:MAG: hypothetical protein JJU18_00125 [Oceanicaulis sp.]|nr:hypothetical protein [Oceanicaulis sp.]
MIWLKWAAAAVMAAALAQAPAAASDDPTRLGLEFFTAINEERWDDVLTSGEALRSLPAYASLPARFRAGIALEMGVAHYFKYDRDSALPYMLEAREIDPALPGLAYYMFMIYTLDGRWMDAAETALAPGGGRPFLDQVRPGHLGAVARGLRTHDEEARLDAYLSLLLRQWRPPEGPPGLDWVRTMMIEAHVKRGEIHEAMDEAQRLTGASALIDLRAERRFEELWTWSGFNELTHVRAGLERETEALRAQLQAPRPALRTGVLLSANLLHLGDLDGAEQAARSLLDRIDSGEQFRDAWEYHAYLYTRLGDVLRARGEDADAEAMYWRAAQTAGDTNRPEMATPHIVDIAHRHVIAGRGQEALDALEQVQESALTGHGQTIVARIRALAAWQTGDEDEAWAQLEHLRENDSTAYLRALLHMGRLEDAEAAMREKVSTPSGAETVLAMLHDYRTHEHAVIYAGQTEARARLIDLAGRPGIADAIAAAGRVLTFDDLYELDIDP